MIRGLVNELKPVADAPGQFLTELNRRLSRLLRDRETAMYATAFYMVIDLERRSLACANAGHPRPLQASRARLDVSPLHFAKGERGPVIGLLYATIYPTLNFPVNDGDTIVLYPDGWWKPPGQREKNLANCDWRQKLKSGLRPPPRLFWTVF